MDLVQMWYEEAKSLHGIFDRVPPILQGQDNVPHFDYFDAERSLSFVWDGDYNQPINVSQGGDGEPVKWLFYFGKMWEDKHTEDFPPIPSVSPKPMFTALIAFQVVCQHWIADMEKNWDIENEGVAVNKVTIPFDEDNPNWIRDPAANELFLKGVQNYACQLLSKRGHLFLNEVYDSLGYPRTQHGVKTGWIEEEGWEPRFELEADGEGRFAVTIETGGDISDKI